MSTRKKKKDNGRGGRRPGAGRKAAPTGRRELVALRLDPSVRQWLKNTVKQRRLTGEPKLTRTRLVEEILKAEMVRRKLPKEGPS
jgi:hypothetical protein